jgi:hypothetical protein
MKSICMQVEVAINSPRIEYSSRQNLLMRAENNSMNQKFSAFSSEIMFKEGIPSLTIPSHEHKMCK